MKFLHKIIALFAIILLPSGVSISEETSTRIFEPLEDEIATAFFERSFDGRAFGSPNPIQIFPADEKLFDVWKGNNPYMRSSVSKVTLEFARAAAEENAPDQAFSFIIEFSKEGLNFKHSSPYYPAEVAGFKIDYKNHTRLRKFFYRGRDLKSVVVLVPAFEPRETDRGLMICPYDFADKGSRTEMASLQDLGFRLRKATAEVTAEVRGFMKSPVDFALAQARLFTTPGVQAPVNSFDQSYGNSAHVSLLYKPEEGQPEEFEAYSNVTLGVEGEIDLHLPAGYHRISTQKAELHIKRMEKDKEWKVPLYVKDITGTALLRELQFRGITLQKQQLTEGRAQPGGCYLVLSRVSPIIHQYLEDELVVPERFLKKDSDPQK